jgi:hypothetical protein
VSVHSPTTREVQARETAAALSQELQKVAHTTRRIWSCVARAEQTNITHPQVLVRQHIHVIAIVDRLLQQQARGQEVAAQLRAAMQID